MQLIGRWSVARECSSVRYPGGCACRCAWLQYISAANRQKSHRSNGSFSFFPPHASLLRCTPRRLCPLHEPEETGVQRGATQRGPTSMDPQAKDRTSTAAAAGGFSGRLASLGADGGDSESGAGSEEAAVGCCSDTFSSLPDMEQETLEDKLKGLAFRKQTSYRWVENWEDASAGRGAEEDMLGFLFICSFSFFTVRPNIQRLS